MKEIVKIEANTMLAEIEGRVYAMAEITVVMREPQFKTIGEIVHSEPGYCEAVTFGCTVTSLFGLAEAFAKMGNAAQQSEQRFQMALDLLAAETKEKSWYKCACCGNKALVQESPIRCTDDCKNPDWQLMDIQEVEKINNAGNRNTNTRTG